MQRDAVTRLFSFDVNTAMAIPNDLATGYVPPTLANGNGNEATREVGNATGPVWVEFIDPLKVKEGKKYDILFEDVPIDSLNSRVGFSVIDRQPQTTTFIARDTFYVNLVFGIQLVEGSVSLTDRFGAVVDTNRYEIDFKNARIRGKYAGALQSGESVYRYLFA